MKKIVLLILIAFSFSGCEKDDICDEQTSTTPELVIEFYDFANPTELQAVTNLRMVSAGFGNIDETGVDLVKIPLRTTATSTTFNFIQNGADSDTTDDNTDVIEVNYATREIFVSRACGYKKAFTLNSPNGIVKTDGTDGAWIQNVIIATPNIETENEVHVKIYF